MKCLMFDLVSTMMKAMNQLSIVGEASFIESLNLVERLLKCETFSEMQSEFVSILKSVSDYVNEKKKSHNFELKDRINEYVQQKYSDLNLSIAAIAEHFNMNAVYLSRFYKEQAGVTLLDTINLVRIKKAKELMQKNEDINMTDTAVAVGFLNSPALIRAFKKYEGVTPGKYKETL